MPNNSKLGSGLDAILGSDINSLLDDIQNGNEPEGVTTSNTSLPLLILSQIHISQERSSTRRSYGNLLIPLKSMVCLLLYW